MNGFLLLTRVSRVFSTGEIRIFFLECYFCEGNSLGDAYEKILRCIAIFVRPPGLETLTVGILIVLATVTTVTHLEGPRNLVGVRCHRGVGFPDG